MNTCYVAFNAAATSCSELLENNTEANSQIYYSENANVRAIMRIINFLIVTEVLFIAFTLENTNVN